LLLNKGYQNKLQQTHNESVANKQSL